MTADRNTRPAAFSLDVEENRSLQHRVWFIQRVSWALFAILIGLAVVGVTGDGGLWAQQTVSTGDVQARLPRVVRRGAADRIELVYPAGRAVAIDLDAAFVAAFDVVHIEPAPVTQRSAGQGVRLVVDGGAEGPAILRLHVMPRQTGLVRTSVTVNGTGLPLRLVMLP